MLMLSDGATKLVSAFFAGVAKALANVGDAGGRGFCRVGREHGGHPGPGHACPTKSGGGGEPAESVITS